MTTNPEIPDDLIEIRDPAIDPDSDRAGDPASGGRASQKKPDTKINAFPPMAGLAIPVSRRICPTISTSITACATPTSDTPTSIWRPTWPSPATRLPVIGRVWATIRQEVHELVLFYVNRAVRQQVMVNRSLVQVVNQLTTIGRISNGSWKACAVNWPNSRTLIQSSVRRGFPCVLPL